MIRAPIMGGIVFILGYGYQLHKIYSPTYENLLIIQILCATVFLRLKSIAYKVNWSHGSFDYSYKRSWVPEEMSTLNLE